MLVRDIVDEVSDKYLFCRADQSSQFKVREGTDNIPPCQDHGLRIYRDLLLLAQTRLT